MWQGYGLSQQFRFCRQQLLEDVELLHREPPHRIDPRIMPPFDPCATPYPFCPLIPCPLAECARTVVAVNASAMNAKAATAIIFHAFIQITSTII
jgi:hypothetical protein